MFFIFNKDKVMSYIVTVFTIGILFFTASIFSNSKETIQTSTNQIINDVSNNTNDLENNLQNDI